MKSARINFAMRYAKSVVIAVALLGWLFTGAPQASAQMPGASGWAVGENGTILFTTNNGQEWNEQQSNTAADLKSVAALKNGTAAWAVGDASGGSGTILRGTKAGNNFNWALVNGIPNQNLKSVSFLDRSNGWAVGDNGTVLFTSNGGAQWNAQRVGTTANLYGVSFVLLSYGRVIGWAVGANGTAIQFTGRYGRNGTVTGNWSAPVTLGSGTFRAISGVNSYGTAYFYAVGDIRTGIWMWSNALFRPRWTHVPPRLPGPDPDLRAVKMISAANIWFGQARTEMDAFNLQIRSGLSDIPYRIWTARDVDGDPPFKYVRGIASSIGRTSPQVWVVGRSGHIGYWDGASWARQDTGANDLNGIVMFPTPSQPVQLASLTSPETGAAESTYLTVTGSGFPRRDITPANVSIELAMDCQGAALASTQALNIVSGSRDSQLISFQLPGGLEPGRYYVSISDSAEGDANFESSNCSAVNVVQ